MRELTVGSLSLADLAGCLGAEGLYFRVGPFVTRVQGNVRQLATHLSAQYAGFPLAGDNDIAQSVVAVRHSGWLRRLVRPQVAVDVDSPAPFAPMTPEHAPLLFETGLNWTVATRCLSYLIFHAGVVAREGRGIIIPAGSGCGKSTLAAGLSLVGWRYLSDEFALIDFEDLMLRPYPRPASLKNESIEIIRGRAPAGAVSATLEDTPKGRIAYLSPSLESVTHMDDRVAPAAIVVPSFDPQAKPQARRLQPAESFMLMTMSSVNYDRFGRRGFDALGRLISDVPVYAIKYPDLDSAIALVDEVAHDG